MCLSVGHTQIDAAADIMPQNKQHSVWAAFVPIDSVLHVLMTTVMVKKTYSKCFFFFSAAVFHGVTSAVSGSGVGGQ